MKATLHSLYGFFLLLKPSVQVILLLFTCSVSCYGQQTWKSVGNGVGRNATVMAFAERDGLVYLGGSVFYSCRRPTNEAEILSTDGDRYFGLGDITITAGEVRAITPYRDGLLVGGSFRIAQDDRLSNFAYWDGERWYPVGEGLNNHVNDILVDGTDIYVGGRFTNAGGVDAADFVARWDGITWHSLGNGVGGEVHALLKVEGQLFIGGAFSRVNGDELFSRCVARWDGTTWHSPTGEENFWSGNSIVYDLIHDGNQLIIGHGGSVTLEDGLTSHGVLLYNAATMEYEKLGDGIWLSVLDLEFHDGLLYAAGRFRDVGGDPAADYVVRFSGTNWESAGVTPPDVCNSLFSTTEGDLYLGGRFRDALDDPDADGVIKLAGNTNEDFPQLTLTHWQVPPVENYYYDTTILNQTSTALLSSFDGFHVCADGSKSSLFEIRDFGPEGLSNLRFAVLHEDAQRDKSSFGEFTRLAQRDIDRNRFIYQHPDFLGDEVTPVRKLTVGIIDDLNCDTVARFNINLHRAPTLFIHGLFSNKGAFKNAITYLEDNQILEPSLIQSADYKATNASSFSDNAGVLPSEITTFLRNIHLQSIAAGKVVAVGHSMGGILSRLYLQSPT
ncbi:MAG: hypothetical protein AAFN92_06675, partial [Bacteroidota bacterium]